MFVTTAISGWSWWKVRSYSSASTTRSSPRAALGVRLEVADHAADEDGRVEAGLLEDHGDHGGGGGLAVRAGDADRRASR